jgi:hypothetical protein
MIIDDGNDRGDERRSSRRFTRGSSSGARRSRRSRRRRGGEEEGGRAGGLTQPRSRAPRCARSAPRCILASSSVAAHASASSAQVVVCSPVAGDRATTIRRGRRRGFNEESRLAG